MAESPTQPRDVAEQIAHELKNPLAGIRGLAVTGLEAYDSLGDDERREFLRLIAEEAVRLERVIGQVADLIRLREGRLTYDLERHDVRTLLADACAGEPRARLDVAGADVTAMCDARTVRQVVRELVANAAAYSPPDSAITVTAGTADGVVEIAVRDEGPGLPAGLEGFPAFTNARPKGYEEVPGAGLGLHLAQAHIAAQGGHLKMVAAEPGGTMLTFTLPQGAEP